MRHFPPSAIVALTLAASASAVALPQQLREPTPMESPGRPLSKQLDPRRLQPMAIDTTLASFTFDTGSGGKDMQGWTMADRTAQLGAFFHVDDFASLGGAPYAPISGTRSLWCGARPCAAPTMDDLCSYATLPGYGNNWDQRFTSVSFSVTGDVSIAFDARYNVEVDYDYIYLEYSVSPGSWQTIAMFTGIGGGGAPVSQTVEADNHPGTIRFRFRFTSDSAYSDEDGSYPTNGAIIIDNLTITDDNGIVDFQNFESEPVGFLFTMDFDWFASTRGQYGIYAALLDGDTVLQEDPSIDNATYLWGFFSGSTANYGCGDHPEQAAVPFGKTIEFEQVHIDNEIRSPEIPYLGVAPGSPVRLKFDVYTDMPRDNLVFYDFRVRSKVGGVWKRWRDNGIVYDRPNKEWFGHSTAITNLLEPGATSIQVAIGVRDMCALWCGIYGSGACHSHGPLIDNVRVVVDHEAFVVTNTSDLGPGSLRDAIAQLNASLYGGVIRFDIPGTGPFLISNGTPLPPIVKSAVIDGTTQPGYDGAPLVRVAAPLPGPGPVLALGAPNSTILGLHLTYAGSDASVLGIAISSNSNVVQRCIVSGCGAGIQIFGSENLVGGTGVGDGNTIYDIMGAGIRVSPSAQRNSVLGNSIYAVGVLGIDHFPYGIVNFNDLGDLDFVQNYPVLTSAFAGPDYTTIQGQLSSTPNTVFRVEFFANDACNPAGNGNGQTFIGFTYGMTDGSGQAAFDEYLAMGVPTGSFITATATDPSGNTSEFSNCVGSINTPSGFGVVTQPADETTGSTTVTVAFDEVTGSGNTSLVTGDSGPPLPGSFDIGDGVYYDLSTTATFTGNFEVCIIYDEAALLVPEGGLRLLHWDDPVWVDITTSLNVGSNTICGETDHFSPFVLVAPTPTAVADSPLPRAFALRQSVPNPFNPTTTISYDVPAGGAHVTIRIYDVSGRVVRTLVDDRRSAGAHEVTWDGRNSAGNAVSTGVYLYRMVAGSFVQARRMVLLK